MHKLLVLGAGMVGSAMAIDLTTKHRVTLADLDLQVLEKARQKCGDLHIQQLDVTDKAALQGALKDFDLVINAPQEFDIPTTIHQPPHQITGFV